MKKPVDPEFVMISGVTVMLMPFLDKFSALSDDVTVTTLSKTFDSIFSNPASISL